jgi:hypothetical protein
MSILGSMITGKVLLIGAIAATIAITVAGATGYSKGKAADKQRSDLVIANMVISAEKAKEQADKEVRALGDKLQTTKDEAEHALQTEQDRNRHIVAAAAADGGRMHRYITDFASGAGAVADSLAACRADARTLGELLDGALQAHARCSESAEREASTARSLLAAWPRTGSVNPNEVRTK